MNKGDKIYFFEEKYPYVVRSIKSNMVVLTKPFNLKHTVLYTILDLNNMIRGPEDLIFCFGAETDKQCNEMLNRILNKESEISYRHRIKAIITKIKGNKNINARNFT
jgi:hypothetical protein